MSIPNFTLPRINLTLLNTKLVQIGQRLRFLDDNGNLDPVGGSTGFRSYSLGDTLYGATTRVLAKLSGNITTTRKFYRQVGDGSMSAAPAWDTLIASDIPAIAESGVTGLVADLALKAPLASPALTGTPTTPTAATDTNTTQIASTAFMIGQAASATPLIDGTATAGTSTRFARADHVHPTDSTRAPVTSPQVTGLNVTDGNLQLNGYRVQSFDVNIANVAGTIKHRIFADLANITLNNYSTQISGASATQNTTPSVNSSTDFTAGGGIDAVNTERFILNTAAQVSASFIGQTVICGDSTGKGLRFVEIILYSLNVNGVTRVRPALYFTDNSGNAVALSTTNIPAGTQITVRVLGFIL